MANGDTTAKGPWWVSLIQAIGPTAAIAVFLVYSLATQITPAIENIKMYMATHVQQMQTMTDTIGQQAIIEKKQWDDLKSVTEATHMDRERSLAVAEQICINQAKSAYQTQQCINARNEGEARP